MAQVTDSEFGRALVKLFGAMSSCSASDEAYQLYIGKLGREVLTEVCRGILDTPIKHERPSTGELIRKYMERT